jgi:hypothetical protein
VRNALSQVVFFHAEELAWGKAVEEAPKTSVTTVLHEQSFVEAWIRVVELDLLDVPDVLPVLVGYSEALRRPLTPEEVKVAFYENLLKARAYLQILGVQVMLVGAS